MSIEIKSIDSADNRMWDKYAYKHPHSTLYHLTGWKNIIEKAYRHKTYYLAAIKQTKKKSNVNSSFQNNPKNPKRQIVGVLPLVHIDHFLFGKSLISIPFFDMGGIIAESEEIEKLLIKEALLVAKRLGVFNIELRNTEKFSASCINSFKDHNPIDSEVRSHKARMLMKLPNSSEVLMKSFKSKLRSQIKKPLKEGLKAKIGTVELINDFYDVFSLNMRDLGSPVHSKRLIKNVLGEFPKNAKIVVIYNGVQPLAASVIVGFRDVLENPWASSLRKYSKLSPNMLLYWTMLQYACENGYKYFDFGRSSPNEGTYRFKKQWGAYPVPLHWFYISFKGKEIKEPISEKSKFEIASSIWKRLPVLITKIIGPPIRKNIDL